MFSAPLWVYRALMMIWALWLAFSLVSWIKWGWQAFSTGGLWKEVHWRPKKKAKKDGKPVEATQP